jgi:hypothetical protein
MTELRNSSLVIVITGDHPLIKFLEESVGELYITTLISSVEMIGLTLGFQLADFTEIENGTFETYWTPALLSSTEHLEYILTNHNTYRSLENEKPDMVDASGGGMPQEFWTYFAEEFEK